MGDPVWEWRIRWSLANGEGHVRHLGSEERAARVVWERERAEFVASRPKPSTSSPSTHWAGSSSITWTTSGAEVGVDAMYFEARKIAPWVVLDDTTPEYARGEEAKAEETKEAEEEVEGDDAPAT
jgi:hypothetical protein